MNYILHLILWVAIALSLFVSIKVIAEVLIFAYRRGKRYKK
jgi:hypothetical protein